MNMKKIKGLPALDAHLRCNQGQRDRVSAAAQCDSDGLIRGNACQRLLESPHGSFGPGALHQKAQASA
jgi:hypothetical protein